MNFHRTTRRRPLAMIYVGVGSNIQPWREIRAGLDRLAHHFGPLDISPAYRCAAIGFDGPPFINLVVGFASALPPQKISAVLRAIEYGRKPGQRSSGKFSSRRLDLDLLLCGDCDDATLQLPRSDITEYAYTLWPLADIAGDSLHPRLQISYRALRHRFRKGQRLRRLAFSWQRRALPLRSKIKYRR